MSELYGRKGNSFYLVDTELKKALVFNSFGESKGICSYMDAVVSINKTSTDVNILSILGESNKDICEILYRGKVSVISKSYLNVYSLLWSKLNKLSHIVFSVKHPEDVSQIIIPLYYREYSHEDIGEIIGEDLVWVNQ